MTQDGEIDSKNFLQYFDQDFRLVKEHEFRKSVFRGVICFNFSIRNLFLN